MAVRDLFERPLGVVSVGIPTYVEAIRAAHTPVVHLDWRPPGWGDPRVAMRLAETLLDRRTEAANATALERLTSARPVLRGVALAREAIRGLDDRVVLHAGPPVGWDAMIAPMQSAVIGAVLLEEWASSPEEARRLLAGGGIRLEPALHHGAAGAGAGVISPSMPVWRLQDPVHGAVTLGGLHEGIEPALRLGAHNDEVLAHLRWVRDVLGPSMGRALEITGPIGVMSMMAQALHMGDDLGMRTEAASGLLFRRLAPALLRVGLDSAEEGTVLEALASNGRFFQGIALAACLGMLAAAHAVPGSSMVTAMVSNGVSFGIRVSGLGDQWFTGPAPVLTGAYHADYGPDDASPYLGDGAMVEAAGLGGFALAAVPDVVRAIGCSPDEALRTSRQMRHVTLGASSAFTLPTLSFAGTALGIDVRLVVDTGLTPALAGEMAHRQAGRESIGVGLTRAPLACFVQAVARLADVLAEEDA